MIREKKRGQTPKGQDDEGLGKAEQTEFIYESWRQALPRGSVLIGKPSAIDRGLVSTHILVRGFEKGWYRGKVTSVHRHQVTVSCEVPGQPGEFFGFTQQLSLDLYSARLCLAKEEFSWVLFAGR